MAGRDLIPTVETAALLRIGPQSYGQRLVASNMQGSIEPENFENETIEAFGVARLEDLPWTHLTDAFACLICNRCQDVCPAYVTGKELSPAALEVNKRYYINGHMQEIAAGAESLGK